MTVRKFLSVFYGLVFPCIVFAQSSATTPQVIISNGSTFSAQTGDSEQVAIYYSYYNNDSGFYHCGETGSSEPTIQTQAQHGYVLITPVQFTVPTGYPCAGLSEIGFAVTYQWDDIETGALADTFTISYVTSAPALTNQFTAVHQMGALNTAQRRLLAAIAFYSQIIGADMRAASAAGAACPPPSEPACIAGIFYGGWGVTVTNGLLTVYLQDPPDPNFTLIAQPMIPALTPVVAQPGITPALAAALNALNNAEITTVAYLQASLTAENRMSGAAIAGNGFWEETQLNAQKHYNNVVFSLLQDELSLLENLQNALIVGGYNNVTITAADIAADQEKIAQNGLPASVIQMLNQAGVDTSTINSLANNIIGIDPNSAAGNFPAQLTNPSFVSAVQSLVQSVIPIVTSASGLAYSRVSRTFNGTVSIKNNTNTTINGPILILFTALTSNVTLVDAEGVLNGSPFITVPSPKNLTPGQYASIQVSFRNPSGVTISFTPVAQEEPNN